MVKHNNVLPNAHFRKEWDMRVKTWLDQPARKQRRREARKAKAAAIAPRPTGGALRPIVRCQTQRYSMKVRAGRGFTIEEIKAAGLSKAKAQSVGIAVDHRRRNKSEEGLAANVARVKLYLEKLVVAKKGQSLPEIAQIKGAVLPIARNATAVTFGSLAEARSAAPGGIVDGSGKAVYTNVFETLRKERANARLVGIREKKAKEAAAKDAAAQKKAGKAGGGEGEE